METDPRIWELEHRASGLELGMTTVSSTFSHPVQIYIAGDADIARQVCREYCFEEGLCVNIQPNEYIYTGGSEIGVRVELINYPRFPKTEKELVLIAKNLGFNLMFAMFQSSFSIQTPTTTTWISRRPNEQK